MDVIQVFLKAKKQIIVVPYSWEIGWLETLCLLSQEAKVFMENQMHTAFHENWRFQPEKLYAFKQYLFKDTFYLQRQAENE